MVRRIDDHSFWAGKGSKESVLPMNAKMKSLEGAEGAGELKRYEDNAEAIKEQQELGVAKAKAHPLKALYRN